MPICMPEKSGLTLIKFFIYFVVYLMIPEKFMLIELDKDLGNEKAYVLGWGDQHDMFCIANDEGPRAMHMCNKWFRWEGMNMCFMLCLECF